MHIGSVQWSYGSIIYYMKVFSIWKHYKLLSNLARNVKKQTFGLQQLIKGNGGVCVLKHFTSTTGVIQEYSKSFNNKYNTDSFNIVQTSVLALSTDSDKHTLNNQDLCS